MMNKMKYKSGGKKKSPAKKMKMGGNFIEPDKEVKFGGMPKKYQGGGDAYPVYGKDTDEAKSFRSAYAGARKSGKGQFEWEGRKYGTRMAGETDEQYETAIKKAAKANTPGQMESSTVKSVSTGVTQRTGLATGSRPSLQPKSKSEERKANRQSRRQERETAKSNADTKTAPKSKASTPPRNSGPGIKISTNTNPTSLAKKSSGMSMSQLGKKEVNLSEMNASNEPASKRASRITDRARKVAARKATKKAAKESAPSRMDKKADRINKRADRVETRKAKKSEVSAAKARLQAARRLKSGGLKTPSEDQKGLKRLPTAVRNKMGYKKNGGKR